MGKKRVATKKGTTVDKSAKQRALSKLSRKRLDSGILYVHATYNNTRVSLTDTDGNLVSSSSSGALGFRGAKKGTPFAAAKVGEIIGEQAKQLGVREADVVVKGVGAGRESAIRAFSSFGINLNSIKDKTPIPFNGPRSPKPRRV
ncbi:MAG: 30S ribosomal protein S11 [Candidatus Paceibacterota bacterium]